MHRNEILFRWLLFLTIFTTSAAVTVNQNFASTEQTRNTKKPNIIWIVSDSLRAKSLTAYNKKATAKTPFIDQLSKEGIIFKNAYSPYVATWGAVSAYFTGKYTSSVWNTPAPTGLLIPEKEITIAEQLQDSGYLTISITAHPLLIQDYGYHQGFDKLIDVSKNLQKGSEKVYGDELLPFFKDEIDAYSRGKQTSPFFMYLHLMDTHHPYLPKKEFISQYGKFTYIGNRIKKGDCVNDKGELLKWYDKKLLKNIDLHYINLLYNASITSFDYQIKEIYEILEKYKLLDSTLVIITADHGEEFYEHGFWTHGHKPWNEVIKVPLFFYWKDHLFPKQSEILTSTLDIYPTLLDLVGVENKAVINGISFAKNLLQDTNYKHRNSVFSEGYSGSYCRVGIFENDNQVFKLIKYGNIVPSNPPGRYPENSIVQKADLYNLSFDPNEKKNLLSSKKYMRTLDQEFGNYPSWTKEIEIESYDGHKGTLTNFKPHNVSKELQNIPMSKELKEQLKALGYLQ